MSNLRFSLICKLANVYALMPWMPFYVIVLHWFKSIAVHEQYRLLVRTAEYKEWNAAHDPGPLSDKCEYESEDK